MFGRSVRRPRLHAWLVTAAVASCVVAPGIAHASPVATAPHSYLVVSSTGNASAVVDLKRAIHVGTPFDGFDARFNGDFAGYFISTVDDKPLLGRVKVRHVGLSAGESVPIWYPFTKGDLPPGHYRITLMGSGPTSVRIPISGRANVTVAATHPAHVFARFSRPTGPSLGPAGEPVANWEIPVPAGHYEVGSLTRFGSGTAMQAESGDECFTAEPTCATKDGDDTGDQFIAVGNVGDGEFASGSGSSPTDLPAGYYAGFDEVDAGLAGLHAGLVVLIGKG